MTPHHCGHWASYSVGCFVWTRLQGAELLRRLEVWLIPYEPVVVDLELHVGRLRGSSMHLKTFCIIGLATSKTAGLKGRKGAKGPKGPKDSEEFHSFLRPAKGQVAPVGPEVEQGRRSGNCPSTMWSTRAPHPRNASHTKRRPWNFNLCFLDQLGTCG